MSVQQRRRPRVVVRVDGVPEPGQRLAQPLPDHPRHVARRQRSPPAAARPRSRPRRAARRPARPARRARPGTGRRARTRPPARPAPTARARGRRAGSARRSAPAAARASGGSSWSRDHSRAAIDVVRRLAALRQPVDHRRDQPARGVPHGRGTKIGAQRVRGGGERDRSRAAGPRAACRRTVAARGSPRRRRPLRPAPPTYRGRAASRRASGPTAAPRRPRRSTRGRAAVTSWPR